MQTSPDQFPAEAHAAFRAIREGHFWFETRRRALKDVLDRLMTQGDGRTLEIGCGDGYLLPILPGRFKVGADASLREVLAARALRGIRSFVVTSGCPMPFESAFSLVGAFDVVEHVGDDAGFVRECAAALAPGGLLAITVPAWPSLWSYLDVYGGHHRRYTPADLRSIIQAAGLDIVLLVPLFRALWPLALISARLRRNRRVTDPAAEFSVGPLANRLLRVALSLEWRMMGRSPIGRGTSLLAVARKGDGAMRQDKPAANASVICGAPIVDANVNVNVNVDVDVDVDVDEQPLISSTTTSTTTSTLSPEGPLRPQD